MKQQLQSRSLTSMPSYFLKVVLESFFFFWKICCILFGTQNYREKSKGTADKEKPFICWFTSPNTAIPKAGPFQSLALLNLSHGCQSPRTWPIFHFPIHKQSTGLEVEQSHVEWCCHRQKRNLQYATAPALDHGC